LIPLMDPGDADAAQRGAAGCRALMTNVRVNANGNMKGQREGNSAQPATPP